MNAGGTEGGFTSTTPLVLSVFVENAAQHARPEKGQAKRFSKNLYVGLVQGLLDFLSHAGSVGRRAYLPNMTKDANFLRKHFARSLSFLVRVNSH